MLVEAASAGAAQDPPEILDVGTSLGTIENAAQAIAKSLHTCCAVQRISATEDGGWWRSSFRGRNSMMQKLLDA